MQLTFYPKAVLITVAFLVMFGATLLLAIDARRGIAAAGILAVLAYLLIDVFIVVNPAVWWRQRRDRRGNA